MQRSQGKRAMGVTLHFARSKSGHPLPHSIGRLGMLTYDSRDYVPDWVKNEEEKKLQKRVWDDFAKD
jgi:hypothetical protein